MFIMGGYSIKTIMQFIKGYPKIFIHFYSPKIRMHNHLTTCEFARQESKHEGRKGSGLESGQNKHCW